MLYEEIELSGCLIIKPSPFVDQRGKFVKTLINSELAKRGIDFKVVEEFYTVSHKNVLRGLHFQTPPCAHYKLVYCLKGIVWDVVVDLRKGSPTYGKHFQITLSDNNNTMLLIPPGLAHGFVSLSDEAIMLYKVTSSYSPEHDGGILWNSARINWPIENPNISVRDCSFQSFAEYDSPFVYNN